MGNEETVPLITIGITCYNAEGTIERAINSAFSQNYQNREILVVDDCSTDSSLEIIKNLQHKIPELKFIRNTENRGPGYTRNTIVENAKGEYIAFFDDDDESKTDRLTVQYRRIRDYSTKTGARLIACYISGERLYPNGYTVELNAVGSREKIPVADEMADYLLFYKKDSEVFYGFGTPTCALMAHKDAFSAVNGFDSELRRLEDSDLAIRLALMGCHFIGCPEKLLIQHSTHAPDKSPDMNLKAEQSVVIKHKKYLQEKGKYYYALHWPLLRFYHFKRDYFRFTLELMKLFVRYPLQTILHLFRTFPKRIMHEKKMNVQA